MAAYEELRYSVRDESELNRLYSASLFRASSSSPPRCAPHLDTIRVQIRLDEDVVHQIALIVLDHLLDNLAH